MNKRAKENGVVSRYVRTAGMYRQQEIKTNGNGEAREMDKERKKKSSCAT